MSVWKISLFGVGALFLIAMNLRAQDLQNGLLGHWPLDGNFSDISGNARHASLSNVNGSHTRFVEGKILNGLDLDGNFELIAYSWRELCVVLNELNRSLGIGDAYPFVINSVTEKKLCFVHECALAGSAGGVLKTPQSL